MHVNTQHALHQLPLRVLRYPPLTLGDQGVAEGGPGHHSGKDPQLCHGIAELKRDRDVFGEDGVLFSIDITEINHTQTVRKQTHHAGEQRGGLQQGENPRWATRPVSKATAISRATTPTGSTTTTVNRTIQPPISNKNLPTPTQAKAATLAGSMRTKLIRCSR